MYDVRGTTGTYITANPASIENSTGYTVRKLADGNCWMTDNLSLPLSAGTSIEASKNDGSVFSWTPTSCSIEGACAMNGSTKSLSVTNLADGKASNEWFYSYFAATAGSGAAGYVYQSAESSICPANWVLPQDTGAQAYTTLLDAYNIEHDNGTATAYLMLSSEPFNLIRAGILNRGNYVLADGTSAYWSSTSVDYGYFSGASDLYLNGVVDVYSQYGCWKRNGIHVRCVAI